ncbi:polysaccharide biosynthesis C-terminal domain-containing protein [Escherichia sp. SS-MK2]
MISSYNVSGERLEVVDIPPGYTHNIKNVGPDEMLVLFWANEIFNPIRYKRKMIPNKYLEN